MILGLVMIVAVAFCVGYALGAAAMLRSPGAQAQDEALIRREIARYHRTQADGRWMRAEGFSAAEIEAHLAGDFCLRKARKGTEAEGRGNE